MTHNMHLYLHRLASDEELSLPAARRVLYVVDGAVAAANNAEGWPERLSTNQAGTGSDSLVIRAVEDTTLLQWDLVTSDVGPVGDALLSARLTLGEQDGHLIRCDRVDFPPGGVARLHTHQGPGTRCLLAGQLRVEVEGDITALGPMEPWFERGPDPVYAVAADEDTAFVRVMVLPRRLLGQSSIRYVREADRDKPKDQRYSVFVDQAIDTPRSVTDHGG